MHVIDFPVDASAYAKEVLDRRDFWIYRDPFFTIGAGSYLDEPKEYYTMAPITNSMLSECVGDIYKPLMETLGQHLSCPVIMLPEAAIPGIHIFNHQCNGRDGHEHIDTPYQKVFWPEPFSNPFSFTVVMQLPECGGGLITGDDYTPYEVNKMYIHSGLKSHRIANKEDVEEDEYRITLQGHGAFLQFSKQVAIYF